MPARLLLRLLVAAALLAGCSDAPASRTEVRDSRVTASPTSAPSSTTDTSSDLPNTPDLSGNAIDCSQVEGPCDHGDDPQLDRLWDACADGDGRACDRLYYDSGFDTRYEQFGNTCGDRDVLVPCPAELS